MIGKLKGVVESIVTDAAIIEVGGVGYEVFCSQKTLASLSAAYGVSVTLYIITHVREDHIHLYGFFNLEEKDTFQTITKINGVGVKMALAMLSFLTPVEIAQAVAAEDEKALVIVPGVGVKLARRIMVELKDKFKTSALSGGQEKIANASFSGTESSPNHGQDAVLALVGLGYSRVDSYRVVQKVISEHSDMPSLDALIKEALRCITSKETIS